MIYFSGTFFILKQFQISLLGTLFYAFSRSMNTRCRFLFPSLYFSINCLIEKIGSVALLPGMNPNCSLDSTTSSLTFYQ